METKYFQINNLNTESEQDGIFEGYASVFNNIDMENDIITNGAFANTLKRQDNSVVLLYQHQHDNPIGIVRLKEDNIGLRAYGELNLDIQKSQEVYSLLKQGALDSMSIGFQATDYVINDQGIRYLNEIELLEVSIVTFPANSKAKLLNIKQNSQTQLVNLFDKLNTNLKEIINYE